VIHYELWFLYSLGYRPKDVIRLFKIARGTAYRHHRLYREAGNMARTLIEDRISTSPSRKKRLNNLDA